MVYLSLHLDEECATSVTEEQHAEDSHQVIGCLIQCMYKCGPCATIDHQLVPLYCMCLCPLAELLLQF